LDLTFGGRLIGRIVSFGPEKYTLQCHKFIKIHQFNHLHRQKHRIIDSNPQQIRGRRIGHFLVLLAEPGPALACAGPDLKHFCGAPLGVV